VGNELASLPNECRVAIRSDADIVAARQEGRTLAQRIGFSRGDQTVIATAISELGRNILKYAGSGEILLGPTNSGSKHGLIVVARDEGPGISDVALAMQDGYSTSNGLGLGLPGTRRLMDKFDIDSMVGRGTTVTVKKWL
jgi:serine/threonine-protein kinase RsbT